MRLILAANILENDSFANFIEAAHQKYPDASFFIAGDILNTFPEDRQYLPDSIVCELYGKLVIEQMDKVVQSRFRKLKASPFDAPLRECFLPTGECYEKAHLLAQRRYERFFSRIDSLLEEHELYFVSGDMDYPNWAECITRMSSKIHALDSKVITKEGLRIAGLGGVPDTVPAIHDVIDLVPNAMANAEFKRRLNSLWGVDVLMTHIAPEENSDLMTFVKKSPLKVLICRSQFNFSDKHNIDGPSQITQIKDKYVVRVGPFKTSNYQALMIQFAKGNLEPALADKFEWTME